MPDQPSDNHPIPRRGFFRAALGEMLKPLGETVGRLREAGEQAKANVAGRAGHAGTGAGRTVSLDIWLRPPGAIAEAKLLETCTSCGQCANACPASAIHVEPGGRGGGAPFIDAEIMPCVMCDTLACMPACPSGALVPTPREQIKMGTAVVRMEQCLRDTGGECTICVDTCPVPEAIALVDGMIEVRPLTCTGCAVCEHHCPTSPKAIRVIPKAARER